MSDIADVIKEIGKFVVRPRYSFSILITGVVILVYPLPEFLKLSPFKEEFGKWIGVATLGCFVLWIVEAVLFFWNRLHGHIVEKRNKKKILDQVAFLSVYESKLFAAFIRNQSQSLGYRDDVSEVHSLIHKKLLESVVNALDSMSHKPFHIPDFVWQYINSEEVAKQIQERAK